MPRPSTFEAASLDAALAKAKAQLGPALVVSEATRTRTGGLGGFFSKETYRVTAVPPAPSTPSTPSTARPASSLALGSIFGTMRPQPQAPAEPDQARPTSLLELADLVDEAEEEAAARVVRRPFPPATAPRLPTASPGPVVATVRPPLALPSTEGETFQDVMRRLVQQTGDPVLAARLVEPAPLPARPTRAPVDLGLAPELLALGVPSSMLPAQASPGAEVAALMRSLHLPAAPPLPSGARAVVAVLGDRRAAAQVAEQLASRFEGASASVRIAAPGFHGQRSLGDPADVQAERWGWSGPTVVAIGAPVELRDRRWALHMLDALSPDTVWGVVGADRKCEDVQAWADAVGGIDALALEQLEATVSPASMLQLGIPIGFLDGRPANPTTWAVLLAERLAA